MGERLAKLFDVDRLAGLLPLAEILINDVEDHRFAMCQVGMLREETECIRRFAAPPARNDRGRQPAGAWFQVAPVSPILRHESFQRLHVHCFDFDLSFCKTRWTVLVLTPSSLAIV